MNLSREQADAVKKTVREKLINLIDSLVEPESEHICPYAGNKCLWSLCRICENKKIEKNKWRIGDWVYHKEWGIVKIEGFSLDNSELPIVLCLIDCNMRTVETRTLRPLCDSDWVREFGTVKICAHYAGDGGVILRFSNGGRIDFHKFVREAGEEICEKLGVPIMPYELTKERAPF